MIIPLSSIPQDTLHNLVESFVLREGTDYGEMEHTLAQKVNHVMMQLNTGEVCVQYSELHETITIVRKDQM